eukprot:gene1742-2083_t
MLTSDEPAVRSPATCASTAALPNGQAVQLIKQVDGKYEVCPEAVACLQGLGPGALAVVAIAGTTRQGKSYILNRLAGAVDGFQVFLDSEGVASHEQTPESEAVLVSLAGMVSSLFIYNHKGAFDEQCVTTLANVAATLKKLKPCGTSPGMNDSYAGGRHAYAAAAGGNLDAEAVMQHPALLVLLRDYVLRSEGTIADAIEKQLQEQDGRRFQAKNSARAAIKEVFTQRLAHALPFPGCDSTTLQTALDSELGSRFQQGISHLRQLLDSTAAPRRVNGMPMTGPIMIQLLQAAVAAANSGSTLSLASIWESAEDAELIEASAAAESAYNAIAGDLAKLSITACKRAHEAALKSALGAFDKRVNLSTTQKQAACWDALNVQWSANATAAVEQIRRHQVEAKVELDKVLHSAKASAVKAFDREGFVAKVISKEGIIDSLYMARSAEAWRAFYALLRPWRASNAHIFVHDKKALIETCKGDVKQLLSDTYNLAADKLRVIKAQKDAQRAAAEKACVAELHRAIEQLQKGLQAAVAAYKAAMQLFVSSCIDDTGLHIHHKEVLSEQLSLLRSLHGSQLQPLPLADTENQLTTECNCLLSGYIQQVGLCRSQAIRAAAEAAVDEAAQYCYPDLVECEDLSEAEKFCQDVLDDFMGDVKLVMARSGLPDSWKTSPEYMAALERMKSSWSCWKDGTLRRIQNNIHASQLRRQQEAAAAEFRRQQEEVERQRQEAANRLRIQQQQEVERQREEASRRWHEQEAARVRREQEEAERRRWMQQPLCQVPCYTQSYYAPCHKDYGYNDYDYSSRRSYDEDHHYSSSREYVGSRGNRYRETYQDPKQLWQKAKGSDGTHLQWYSGAVNYWDRQEASYDGVLGGFGFVSDYDIMDSKSLLQRSNTSDMVQLLLNGGCFAAVVAVWLKLAQASLVSCRRSADCGAGVGRVSEQLLLRCFHTVDLLEPSRHLLDAAQKNLKAAVASGSFPAGHQLGCCLCEGLQEFQPQQQRTCIRAIALQIVWEWRAGSVVPLMGSIGFCANDALALFQRCKAGLKSDGIIMVKENICKEGFVVDKDDNSLTRSNAYMLDLFSRAGMSVQFNIKQRNFPKELFEVRMYVLKPSQSSC